MSSIDERIVEMQFKNSQFESGVKTTLSTLERLEQGLNLNTAGISRSMSGIADNLDTVKSRLSIFGAVGFTAIQSLTNSAISAGKSMASALIDPIREGGKKRALSIAQAKFQFEGLGMDIEATMKNALDAVTGTAFGLDEAAMAAANFGATGMKAGTEMANALRGISGVASMAGASYSDIANIFSKVAGQGRLMGDDLNRLAARGINAAATLAQQMGITEGEVRKMVSKGEISFQQFADSMNKAFGDQAMKANQLFTGALANVRAALGRVGAGFAEIKFESQRRMLVALIPVIDAINGGLQPLRDRYLQVADATASAVEKFLSFTEVADGDKMKKVFNNKAVQDFVDSLTYFSQAAANVSRAVSSYLRPIGQAFSQVFLSGTPFLTKVAQVLSNFTQKLILNESTVDKVRRAFAGFFSIFKIGLDIFGGAAKIVLTFFGAILGKGDAIGSVGGMFLTFAANVGDLIVRFREWLHEGDRFSKVISGIQSVIRTVIGTLKDFGSRLGDALQFLRTGDIDGFRKAMGDAMSVFDPFRDKIAELGGMAKEALGEVALNIADWFKGFDSGFFDFIGNIFENLGEKLTEAKEGISSVTDEIDTKAVKSFRIKIPKIEIDWSNIGASLDGFWESLAEGFSRGLGNVQTILGGVFSMLGGMFKGLIDFVKTRGTGELLAILNTIFFIILNKRFKDVLTGFKTMIDEFKGLTGSLKGLFDSLGAPFRQFADNMKMAARGNFILKVAVAVAILAGSLWLLSRIPADELFKAGLAVTAMLVALGVMVLLMSKIDFAPWSFGLFQIGIAMAGLGVAMLLFAKAAQDFAAMDTDQLLKGLGAIGAILLALTIFTAWGNMSSMTIRGAIALGILALTLRTLADTVRGFADLAWDKVGEGLGIMALALAGVTAALYLIPPDAISRSVAILAVAGALWAVAEVIEKLSSLQGAWGGMLLLATGLLAIVAALTAANTNLKGGVGIAIVSGAILVLAFALGELSKIPFQSLVGSLLIITGALLVFVVAGAAATAVAPGMYAIAGVIAAIGIAAAGIGLGLLLAAYALDILTGAFERLADKPETVATAMDIFAEAALRNVDAIGALVGMGIGLFILGAGLAVVGGGAILAGAGLIAAGLGLALFTRYGEPGAEAIKNFVSQFNALDLLKITGMAAAFSAFGTSLLLVGVGAATTGAGMVLLGFGLVAFTAAASFSIIALALLVPAINAVNGVMPKFANIGTTASTVGTQLWGASGQINAFYVSMQNMANGLTYVSDTIDWFIGRLQALQTQVSVTFLTMQVSSSLFGTAFVAPFVTASTAVDKETAKIIKAIEDMSSKVKTALDKAASATRDGANKMASEVRGMQNKINSSLRTVTSSVTSQAQSVGAAIANGMIAGMNNNSGRVASAAAAMAQRAVSAARANLVVSSPSKVFEEMGKFVAQGLALGISRNAFLADNSAADIAKRAITSASDILGISSPSKAFIALGKFVSQGFAKGIRGEKSEVESAFKQLTDEITKARDSAAKDVKSLEATRKKVAAQNAKNAKNLAAAQARLRKRNTAYNRKEVARYQAAYDKSSRSLRQYTARLAESRKELAGANSALKNMSKTQNTYLKQQEVLNNRKAGILEKLEKEREALKAAKQAYDDYNKSVKESYDDLPDITGEDSNVATYLKDLEKQILETSAFNDVMDQLSKLGLNDELYRELVSKGLDSMPFALSLLDAGGEGIAAVNELGAKLVKVSERIGKSASDQLYLAGVQSAEGIVKGLESQEAAVNKALETLAQRMVASLKKELGIKSPSRVFMMLGKQTSEGFVKGLGESNRAVEKSAESMGSSAIDAFRKTIAGLSDKIDADIDLNPTITPVLDLSQIEKKAQSIQGLLGRQTISTETGYSRALSASRGREMSNARDQEAFSGMFAAGPSLSYVQNNYSPKPLSRVEIYRQTHNQLSSLKGALDI